jgi:hypothetical protein
MDFAEQIEYWFIQNLSGIIFLILGSALGFLSSWATARYTLKAEREEEERRKIEQHKALWKQSLADLIGELEQNQQHQSLDKWIALGTSAYGRFRSQGLMTELDPQLQIDLRRLYSYIHHKNDLVRYYQNFIPGLLPEERKQNAPTLVKMIGEVETEVTNRIFMIIPPFLELQKKAG